MTTSEPVLSTNDPIYIPNAGLVLTAPFQPHLFRILDMTANNTWKDAASSARAPHLLQWLVDGSSDTPEPALVLNKLLCGLPLSSPLDTHFEITEREQEVCTQLLQAMLASWTAIASSSVVALRETFLQREGKLLWEEDRWNLQVQRRGVDVLIERIPWSISNIHQSWMTTNLHVAW